MKRLVRVLPVMLLILFTAGSVWANGIITLEYLFAGNPIFAGDKRFDSWTFLDYTSTDSSRSFNPANIGVSPFTNGVNNPVAGLQFDAFNDELYVTGNNLIDLSFRFHVTVLDPNLMIRENGLSLTAFDASSGGNGSSIDERVGTSADGADLGTKHVGFSYSNFELYDSAIFTPQSDIWVTTDILIWATSSDEWTRLSSFEQSFSQTPVPEPSTFLLLGGGLACLAFYARRRRKG